MKIKFIDNVGIPKEYYVMPSIKEIPDWYKRSKSYSGDCAFPGIDINGKDNATLKKCIPLFDAMTSGYIIKTYIDVAVTQQDGSPYFSWPIGNPISIHPIEQVQDHPMQNGFAVPKWMSPWTIKTKNGVSCLFVPPLHRKNDIFTIFPGIVDTDKYFLPINFPFVLNDTEWEGIIPAGTPIAQVIPFKRNNFSMKIFDSADDVLSKENRKQELKIRGKINSSYKNFFWTKKKYN